MECNFIFNAPFTFIHISFESIYIRSTTYKLNFKNKTFFIDSNLNVYTNKISALWYPIIIKHLKNIQSYSLFIEEIIIYEELKRDTYTNL